MNQAIINVIWANNEDYGDIMNNESTLFFTARTPFHQKEAQVGARPAAAPCIVAAPSHCARLL